MKLDFVYNGRPITVTIDRAGEDWWVSLPEGSARSIRARRLPDGMVEVHAEDRSYRAAVARVGEETHVSHGGQLYVFGAPSAGGSVSSTQKETGQLTAPMPGVVADVLVKVGERVAAYQPVVIVEAMKVMATVEAPFAGVVEEVAVIKGQRVSQQDRLALIVRDEVDSG